MGPRCGRIAAAWVAALLLGACVSVPQGPTVAVMPGSGKSLDQFRADSGDCQQFAQASIGSASQGAQDHAAATAVGGAAVGAAVGALLGSVTGQAGAGAAWGAGTGLLFGGAAAGNAGAASTYTLQRQFDMAYMQCMYTHGNQVPARVVTRGGQAAGASSWSHAQPPTRYAVPSNAATPPPGTPAPAHSYGVPANAAVPPPDTPPPQGLGAPLPAQPN